MSEEVQSNPIVPQNNVSESAPPEQQSKPEKNQEVVKEEKEQPSKEQQKAQQPSVQQPLPQETKVEVEEKEQEIQQQQKPQTPPVEVEQNEPESIPEPVEDVKQEVASNKEQQSPIKAQDQKQKQKVEVVKLEEIKEKEKKGQTQTEIVEQYLSSYKSSEQKQVKLKIVTILNELVQSKLTISSAVLQKYLQNDQPEHALTDFKEWLEKEEQITIGELIQAFNKSSSAIELSSHLKKLETVLYKATSSKNSLKLHVGLGEIKGKSTIKFGMQLRQQKSSQFSISVDVKIKKKSELKQFIDNQLKKRSKSADYHISKLCKYSLNETDKGLNITVTSIPIEEFILKDTIELISKLMEQEERPVLKVQGEVCIKNSLRDSDTQLQKKRLVKWAAEGLTSSIRIDGSSALAHHFTSPIAQIFPLLSVIKSGQVNLRLKASENVDKWFDKLGINELSEQTPTLLEFLQMTAKDYLQDSVGLWVADLLKKSLIFACNIPNERIAVEVGVNIGQLHLWLGLWGDACKQIGDIVAKVNKEQFS